MTAHTSAHRVDVARLTSSSQHPRLQRRSPWIFAAANRTFRRMNSQAWEAGSTPADMSMDTLDDVDIDFALAAQGGSCVLLTAPPGAALLAARELVSRGCSGRIGIDVLDCHIADAVAL